MANYKMYDIEEEDEILRRKARARKRAEKKRRKKRRFYIRVAIRLTIYLAVLVGIIWLAVIGIKRLVTSLRDEKENESTVQASTEQQIQPQVDLAILSAPAEEAVEEEPVIPFFAQEDENTGGFPAEVVSSCGIFIDVENDLILAQHDAKTRMFPASMTKVLTCLVAAEHVTDLDDTFTMTPEINYYAYKNDCSCVGFSDEEVVTVRDLFYGTILPSGGDAAVGLATYVAGSHEAFVDMMNAKLDELGLSETTHFTNCVGLYDDNHYSTCYDMAMIMRAAMENELCRSVMHEHQYTTSSTLQHPDGIEISNWFLRRIEDHVTGGEIYCGKTGFVEESGNCATSLGISASGKEYICVTGNSTSSWRCIKDHVAIYKTVFESATDGQ